MAGLYLDPPVVAPGTAGRELVWRCATVRRALWRYLDGELEAADARDVETHCTVCAACELERASRAALQRLVRRARRDELDEVARARVSARIARALDAQGLSGPIDIPSATVRPGPGR